MVFATASLLAAYSACRISIGSIFWLRSLRQSAARALASARETALAEPRPISLDRPCSMKRKTQDLLPDALTWRYKPPPSESRPFCFALLTSIADNFPFGLAIASPQSYPYI